MFISCSRTSNGHHFTSSSSAPLPNRKMPKRKKPDGPDQLRKPTQPSLFLGCAGWSIPRAEIAHFPDVGSHLQRYAQVFNAVEINSSFYRDHLPLTYRRWAVAVPGGFRFSVKFPRSISHERRLRSCDDLLDSFLSGVHELDGRLGCLLLQLPPTMEWDRALVLSFLDRLRRVHAGPVACEPRHASWFHPEVSRELATRAISRVAADPALRVEAQLPAGDRRLQYLRLHGSPRRYYDSYADATMKRVATHMKRPTGVVEQRWCMFDNTAAGHATANALALKHALGLP